MNKPEHSCLVPICSFKTLICIAINYRMLCVTIDDFYSFNKRFANIK